MRSRHSQECACALLSSADSLPLLLAGLCLESGTAEARQERSPEHWDLKHPCSTRIGAALFHLASSLYVV